VNRLDEIIQGEFTTVMVPKHEELPPLRVGKTRLLMARDGLYIEAVQHWGRLIRRLWSAPRPLPYGEIEEIDTFKDALQAVARSEIMGVIVEEAARCAERGREWIGWVFSDCESGELFYQPLDFDSTRTSVDYRKGNLDGVSVAVDVHSHGRIAAGFSPIDDRDDSGGVRIAVVLGNFREEKGQRKFDYAVRYCVQGFFLPTDMTRDIEEVIL
jgi:PRTRC genetic system protein A